MSRRQSDGRTRSAQAIARTNAIDASPISGEATIAQR